MRLITEILELFDPESDKKMDQLEQWMEGTQEKVKVVGKRQEFSNNPDEFRKQAKAKNLNWEKMLEKRVGEFSWPHLSNTVLSSTFIGQLKGRTPRRRVN